MSDDPPTDQPAVPEDQAIAGFRASAEAMGLDVDDADDLIEQARDATRSGGITLGEALAQELAELSVHLGREG